MLAVSMAFAVGTHAQTDTASTTVSAQPAVLTPDMLEEVTSYVNGLLDEYQTPGAAVAIVQNEEIIYAEGFGVTDPESNTPVDADTLFMIGSTTKSMTSFLAATLVDDGVWAWDDLVIEHFPSFALRREGAAEQIRVRDLFNMSTGVMGYDWPILIEALTPPEALAELAFLPDANAPGEAFHYSNMVFGVAGYLTAALQGAALADADTAYADLLQTHLFDPLGMTSSTVDYDAALLSENRALPYTVDLRNSSLIPVPLDQERAVLSVMPAGAVWSSAADMGRYMQMYLNDGITSDGARVLSSEALNTLWTPQIPIPGSGSYALGWIVEDFGGQRVITHGGNNTGFTSEFTMLPDADLGVLVLSNRSINNNFSLAIRDYVFELAFGREHTADARYAEAEADLLGFATGLIQQFPRVPIDAEIAARYTGEYERSVRVSYEEATSQIIVTSEVFEAPLIPSGQEGVFYVDVASFGTLLQFAEDEDGTMIVTLSSLNSQDSREMLTLRRLS